MKITSLLLKITSRCNLNCKYCYMYNLEDTSYSKQPKFMSREVCEQVIIKTYKHCIQNDIKEFLFVFHGGEPLLCEDDFFVWFVTFANNFFENRVKLYYAVHSNGTLFVPEIAEVFSRLKIQIGISLDGDKNVNDKNRLYKNGRSSYNDVITGINNCLKYPFHAKTMGILSVINLDKSPEEVYFFFKTIGISVYDLNFPYYTYETYPFIEKDNDTNFTPYADWLIKVFDLWYNDANRPNIKMFSGFINCFLGEEYPNDLFGSYDNGLLVINTDGEIEPIDYLKACGEEFVKTNMNIKDNNLSDTYSLPNVRLYYKSHSILPDSCKECPVNDICGGTNLPARYSDKNGFNNKSIYCKDILKLLAHIQRCIAKDLKKIEMTMVTDLDLIDYDVTIHNIMSINNKEQGVLSSYKKQLEI